MADASASNHPTGGRRRKYKGPATPASLPELPLPHLPEHPDDSNDGEAHVPAPPLQRRNLAIDSWEFTQWDLLLDKNWMGSRLTPKTPHWESLATRFQVLTPVLVLWKAQRELEALA